MCLLFVPCPECRLPFVLIAGLVVCRLRVDDYEKKEQKKQKTKNKKGKGSWGKERTIK
jgi:hypothetical protein